MSKGNMLLGYARGKVGDLVFSRQNGQQITRARATKVKNPQTEAQMIRRIIMNTVAQAYSRFSALTDHSFEGIQSGQKSMSYFMQKNIDLLASNLSREVSEGYGLGDIYAFSPLSSNQYAANAYIIAKGTLPSVAIAFDGQNHATVAVTGNTYQDVVDALGLQRGDQLTFVATQGTTGERTAFHYARVILSPTNADGSGADMSTPFIVDGSVNLPSPRNTGIFNVLAYADGNIQFNFSNQVLSGAAVIVSRRGTDDNWLRSNTTLEFNEAAVAGWQLSMQECLDLFAVGGVETVNSRYLNNAGTQRLAGTGGGGSVNALTAGGTYVTLNRLTVEQLDAEGTPTSYAIAYDSNGGAHLLKMMLTSSRVYSFYAGGITGMSEDIWTRESAPDGFTSNDAIAVFDIDNDVAQWLVANGFSQLAWTTNAMAVPNVTSIKYGTSPNAITRDWPSGEITLADDTTLYIAINGTSLGLTDPTVTRAGSRLESAGDSTQRTVTAAPTSTNVQAVKVEVSGITLAGTVNIKQSQGEVPEP